MSKLEKYPSYKKSGVEWLGEIPEQWNVQKSKFFHNNIKLLTQLSHINSSKFSY